MTKEQFFSLKAGDRIKPNFDLREGNPNHAVVPAIDGKPAATITCHCSMIDPTAF